MKILLMLNGPEGIQTGIEDGFTNLLQEGIIKELKWFYYTDYEKKFGTKKTWEQMIMLSEQFQPNVIIFFHLGQFTINEELIRTLKNLTSKPKLIYDEGDMYGGWAKPLNSNLKKMISLADLVSIRGLGRWYRRVKKINNNIIYTPHHADLARFDKEPYILTHRNTSILFIGNSTNPRIFSKIKRLHGGIKRDQFVKYIGLNFQNDLVLYGKGWNGYHGNKGTLDFQKQLEEYRNSWITIAYEHYPEIPYYFSNRLPMALLAGSLYVCHYHAGYENIFKNTDFIFFFNNNREASDIIKYLLSLNKDDLIERSKRARQFALEYLTPEIVWKNFLNNSKNFI